MLSKIITEEKKLDGPSVEPYQFTNEVSLVSEFKKPTQDYQNNIKLFIKALVTV